MSRASFKNLAGTCLLAVGLAFVPQSEAAVLEYSLVTELSSSGAVMSGPVKVTFDDAAGPADVRLTIDLSGWTGGLGEYLAGLYFNYSDAQNTGAWEASFSAAYNFAASTNMENNELSGVSEGFNEFKANGQGHFDVWIEFGSAAASRFIAGEIAVFDITAPGADVFDFAVGTPDAGNDHLIARARALIDPTPNDDEDNTSGWFTGPGCELGDPTCDEGGTGEVPEPSTMLLMGGSLIALGYFRKRRNS